MTELMPCPFCKMPKAKVSSYESVYFVECPQCLATGSVAETPERAIAFWNKVHDGLQESIMRDWISVDDRLPDAYSEIWAYSRSRYYRSSCVSHVTTNKKGQFPNAPGSDWVILAWMPLEYPDPPELPADRAMHRAHIAQRIVDNLTPLAQNEDENDIRDA